MQQIADAHRAINDWFLRTAGGDDRTAYYDIDRCFPQLRQIDEAFVDIRAEAEKLMERRFDVPRLHETDPGQECISAATPHDWRVYYLVLAGAKARLNMARCPVTSSVLARVPGMYQACFSILDPGKSVPPHRGPYGGYLRYHLGLIVPEEDPPQLTVKGQDYTWREGESVLFDDTLTHAVSNTSTQPRVVLIVDVFRPMPWPQTVVNRAAGLVGTYLYGRPTLRNTLEISGS